MNPAMSSPLKPTLQLDFNIYWTHGLLKVVFYSASGFYSPDMLKVVALT